MIEEEHPKDDTTAAAADAGAGAPAAVQFNPVLEIVPGNPNLTLVLQDDGLHLWGGKPNLHGL